MTNSYNKIFQIGFNKCGTSSIYRLFSKYAIPNITTRHWNKGLLAYSMVMNERASKPLLSGKYEHVIFFSDMESYFLEEDGSTNLVFMYTKKYIQVLDEQYPNSIFILNTRNIDNWIKSRMSHFVVFEPIKKDKKNPDFIRPPILYKDLHKQFFGYPNDQELEKAWRKDWIEHIDFVQSYFQYKPQNLLVFDIENDTIDKFKNFFTLFGIDFKTNTMPHINRTK